MNETDLWWWCDKELREQPPESQAYRRAQLIMGLFHRIVPAKYLADAAEALGDVKPSDGTPNKIRWDQVIAGINELREDRDFWKEFSQRDKSQTHSEHAIDELNFLMELTRIINPNETTPRSKDHLLSYVYEMRAQAAYIRVIEHAVRRFLAQEVDWLHLKCILDDIPYGTV